MINLPKSNDHIHIFSTKFKQNIIQQAASMLLQHITFKKQFSYLTKNSNGNAFDERLHIQRTNKCNSWLSKCPTKSDTSLDRLIKYSNSSRRFHHNQIILSSNAVTNNNSQSEISPQPLVLIHKTRLPRDYFLSTIQNCIQPPYSQNHFYAFDQLNMLKLQQSISKNSKRKYSNDDDESEIDINQRISLSKKAHISPPLKTADHISINKYHQEIDNNDKNQSQLILSNLEKILNLCTELRTLANDVKSHLNEKQSILSEDKSTDIEKPTPPSYQSIEDTLSIHSESQPIMQTESFKTKSPSLTTSETVLRKPEDICSCFLKSIFDKEHCRLNTDEKEYLEQLTKAYLLGREQILREQFEENNKFQAFLNPDISEDSNEFNTNNNNQLMISSSISLNKNIVKSDEQLSSIPFQSSNATGVMSNKHQTFMNEPISMKTTNVLPGIGIKYSEQLAEYGFSTVRRLLGFYLIVKDDQNFVNWLNNKVQISIHSAWLCTNALRDWCQIHL